MQTEFCKETNRQLYNYDYVKNNIGVYRSLLVGDEQTVVNFGPCILVYIEEHWEKININGWKSCEEGIKDFYKYEGFIKVSN